MKFNKVFNESIWDNVKHNFKSKVIIAPKDLKFKHNRLSMWTTTVKRGNKIKIWYSYSYGDKDDYCYIRATIIGNVIIDKHVKIDGSNFYYNEKLSEKECKEWEL